LGSVFWRYKNSRLEVEVAYFCIGESKKGDLRNIESVIMKSTYAINIYPKKIVIALPA
jgi:hypothetical protein